MEPTNNKKSNGAVIGSIIIVLIIIVGGVYMYSKARMEKKLQMEQDQAARDSVTDSLSIQSNSDDLDSIDADLQANNMDNLVPDAPATNTSDK